ncbi:unnamed protein product [Owenia fusiformis]|uniref:Anosmin-1 n=1 Tax=Owenia fusiformis TaxID=6347 RepID=A0A8S4NJG2_OWEFU|nr:unnamed protein product [Owenia fusiformis]
MSPVFGFMFLWIINTVGQTHGSTESADIESARCKVRCLIEYLKDFERRLGGTEVSMVRANADRCRVDRNCSTCSRPCSTLVHNIAACTAACQNETACLLSCHFIRHIHTTKHGQCPSRTTLDESQAQCTVTCDKDTDCGGVEKCCDNGCGYTCQSATNADVGLPETTTAPEVRERPKGKSVELTWEIPSYKTPIVYIIQGRTSVGMSGNYGPWQMVMESTRPGAIWKGVKAGHWYQFRIVSVNINGSSEHSEHSVDFKLTKEPRSPSEPTDFREGGFTLHDGMVNVRLLWEEPRKSDLPISKYKIFWTKQTNKVPLVGEPTGEHKRLIAADKREFELKNLEPDTRYMIQIQALAPYGNRKLKSEKVSLEIETYPLSQSTERDRTTPSPSIITEVDTAPPVTFPIPGTVQNITFEKPFYQNGLLKARISWLAPDSFDDGILRYDLQWSPNACIALEDRVRTMSDHTENEYFELYDLKFDCQYQVKVIPVSTNHIVGMVGHAIFYTPECPDVHVMGEIVPDCPTDTPSVPREPQNINYRLIIINQNISAEITWSKPQSDRPIISFRVTWGAVLPMDEMKEFPHMDMNTALTKVLSNKAKLFSIDSLREGTSYIVQVQALSKVGSGMIGQVQFEVPFLYSSRIRPPDHDIQHQEPSNTKHLHSNKADTAVDVDAQVEQDNKDSRTQSTDTLKASATCPSITTAVLIISVTLVPWIAWPLP